METQSYEIYYGNGLNEGVDEAAAIIALAEAGAMPEEKAKAIICSTDRVIKSDLSKPQAEHYFKMLDGAGLQVEIRLVEPDVAEGLHEAADVTDAQATQPPSLPAETQVAPSGEEGARDIPVEFHGKGFEYFKIWIVNILLTILTLGIYSAWAKVRNSQYFYGNTLIDGSSFQYTAKPIQILKGRIIAIVIFLAYIGISEISPILALVLALIFLIFLPWIVIRSLAFNARNSMYRNIRFCFTGGVGDAVITFVVLPILTIFTFGLLIPYVWYKQTTFIVGNHAFGTTAFEFNASPMAYYKVFLILFLAIIVTAVVMTGLMIGMGSSGVSKENLGLLLMPFLFVAYLGVFAYLAASLGNLYFNCTEFAGNRFTSTLQARGLAWLYVTNTLGIVLSLGLLIPWAKVRTAAYRAECLTLHVKTSLDSFIAGEEKSVSALGEEVGEVFDVDVVAI